MSKCYKNKHQEKYVFNHQESNNIIIILNAKIQNGFQYGRHYYTESYLNNYE